MKLIVDKLKSLELLKAYSEQELSVLAESVEVVRLNADLSLFEAGAMAHSCYIVLYGGVKMLRPSPAGRQMVMCFLRAGDFVAAGVMNKPATPYPLSCVTLEDSAFLKISREAFLANWQTRPDIMKNMQQVLTTRMFEFQQDKALASAKVSQRIAAFLLRSLEGQNANYGSTLTLKLTRKDIADRVGTSVETVIRILSEWTQRNLISTEEQRITILNRPELDRILNED